MNHKADENSIVSVSEEKNGVIKAYIGLGNDLSKLTVQKSRAFLDVARTGLSLGALKIFDIFLARINSHNPEICTVIFSKKELERLFGVKQLRTDTLRESLKELLRPIEFEDESKIRLMTVFSYAEIEKDRNGLNMIKLTCSDIAKKFIYNIEPIGYLSYQVLSCCRIYTYYSYNLFTYVMDNSFRSKWDVPLTYLKTKLGAFSQRYDEFKYFKRDVLEKAKKEIEEKTSLRFTYDCLKTGKNITGILFTITHMLDKITFEDFETLEDDNNIPSGIIETSFVEGIKTVDETIEDNLIEIDCGNNSYDFIARACRNEFDEAQMKHIAILMSKKQIPAHPYGTEFACETYLSNIYKEFNKIAEKGTIPKEERYNYFVRMFD